MDQEEPIFKQMNEIKEILDFIKKQHGSKGLYTTSLNGGFIYG